MFTLGLIGSNLDIKTFFSSLSQEQKKTVTGLQIIGDTYDECSAKLQKPPHQSIEHFTDETQVLIFLSETAQSFELAINGLKLGKNIILARYSYLDLDKIERLEKLSKEAERTVILLPTSDFLQRSTDTKTAHTFYIHRERHVANFHEASLVPVLYTDLLQIQNLSHHVIDRIKVLSSPKLMNEHSPITLSVSFTNGLHGTLVYSLASERNLFILYQGAEVKNIEQPLQATAENDYRSEDATIVSKLLTNAFSQSGLHDAPIIKQALVCVKEMIK